MPRRISNNQLTPDATYLVRGQVGFGIITRHTTDDERKRQNEKRLHKIEKNYSTMTIFNAQVLAKDPQNPTIEEQYAIECLYESSSPNYPGKNFTGLNKSRNLPRVGVLSEAGHYVEITPQAELATGSDVTLVMRVFKGQGNNGVSLDMVLINDTEPKYYVNASSRKALEDYGIVFEEKIPQRSVEDETNAQADVQSGNMSQPVPQAQTVATPVAPVAPAAPIAPAAPVAPAVPPADGNPFSSYNNGGYAQAPQPVNFNPGTRMY